LNLSCLSCRGRSREFRPAADLLSFASPKESRQRKGDPTVCVPPLRYGQPAVLGESGGPQNSLHFVALRQLRPLSRFPLRSSAQPEGRRVNAPWRVLVWGGGVQRPSAFFYLGRAKRRPVGLPRPSAAMARSIPSGCAEGRSVSRIRARSCLSGTQWSEFCETPRNASTAGCPVAKRRGRRQRGRLFFGYFLLAKQKKVTRPPGRVPAYSLSKRKPHPSC